MKDRILQIMGHEGLVPSKFAEAIGIQRSAMSHIVAGRNNPSLDVITKILDRFTYVDPDWLLLGKGQMMRSSISNDSSLLLDPSENPNSCQVLSENREDFGVDHAHISCKHPIVQQVICEEKPSKNVSKIMIFYSDNTFDTFVPEKTKKD